MSQVIEVSVSAGSDDAEEVQGTGQVFVNSSDLELVDDADYVGQQTVGIRFDGLDIPPGATITAAWIEFTVDERQSVATTLTVKAQASVDAPTFTTANFNVSNRPTTASTVTWSPPAWPTVGASGSAQQTADLSVLVQEVVSQPGWTEGNAIAFIVGGSGHRTAEAFESGQSTAAVLHVEYTVGTPPVATADTAATDEDTPVVVAVLANDNDVEGDPLTVTAVGQPAHGTATANANGTITYTPAANFNGADSFSYTISDGQGGTANATVTVNMAPVDDLPTAVADSVSTAEDVSVLVAVLANDIDPDGNPLTVTSVEQPDHGVAVINGNGTVTYTPTANFNGADSFSYTISDGEGGTASATVTVNVTPVNDIPTTVADTANTAEDTPVVVTVLANDVDADGDALTVTTVGQPTHGTATVNANGTVTYTPAANFNGADSFSYTVSDGDGGSAGGTVSVNVAPLNDAPTANANSLTAVAGNSVTFAVMANDADVDSDPLLLTDVGSAANGIVVQNPNGTVTYAPDAGFSGTDAFTYTISDGNGGMATGSVSVTVLPEQDPQVIEVSISAGSDDVEESSATGAVYVNSSDLELTNDVEYIGPQTVGLRFDGLDIPPDAIITEAWIEFTVDERDISTTSMTIEAQASDDAATFTTTPFNVSSRPTTESAVTWSPNPWPTVGASGTAQQTSDLSVLVQEVVSRDGWEEGNAIAFVLTGNAAGKRTAEAFESGQSTAAVLHIEYTIGGTNASPVAAADAATTAEDTSVTLTVLANDIDPDGNPLTVAAAGQAEHGAVVINGNGTVTYTPDAEFVGDDSFSYTISDGQGGLATATVDIAVSSVNDVPTAIDDLAVTAADTPVSVSVLVNDHDDEDDLLTITEVGEAENGTAVAQLDGSILYTPNPGFAGIDSFTYTVDDGNDGTDTATVTVHAGVGFEPVTFAVIGDYGVDNGFELAVSNLVKSFDPDFIVTLGDNAYGSLNTPDNAVGKYYSDYIGDYQGIYGPGSETNRFFPALGNHDWTDGGGLQAYLDFFTLPESSSGNERYYDFVMGPVQFFMVDADAREPDGETADSAQAEWLEEGLANSVTPWQVVIVHEPPYSSGAVHGPHEDLQWPYEEWGADAVLSGDEHSYERLLKDDDGDGTIVPYFVNGAGGAGLYPFSSDPDPDSAFRYNDNHGAMLVTATDTEITFEFWSIANGGTLVDTYTIAADDLLV